MFYCFSEVIPKIFRTSSTSFKKIKINTLLFIQKTIIIRNINYFIK
nr:MAG TPA: hypothetical protein [Caudoviricetes sp.]